jgi:ubiquinone/menaquinone biosynthesis C-methylase UbiE
MGRFATTVEFYERYREPYPASFFKAVAQRIALGGNERLLDVACGPAPLAIGFAPFVGTCTGLDPEAAMIAAARSAAAKAGVSLSMVHGRLEEFPAECKFDFLTIGRAIHWMERDAALPVLEQITSENGHILICGATSAETPARFAAGHAATGAAPAADAWPWVNLYEDTRHRWATTPYEHYRVDAKAWFEGSHFRELDTILVSEEREVTIADLVGRALSKSNTSPEVLGERRAEFEAEITAVLEPFAQDGVLREEIVARASIFARQPS